MGQLNNTNNSSILDRTLLELKAMDIDTLRDIFLKEIKDLEFLEDRGDRLNDIFIKLFRFQPTNKFKKTDFNKYDHNLFFDLVTTPGLSDISYVREYLANTETYKGNFISMNQRLLLKVYEYYDTHSKEEIEKFNYVFRSTSNIAFAILNGISFEELFEGNIFKLFDKETVSQIYRWSLSDSFFIRNFRNDLLSCSDKSMYILAVLADKLKEVSGHNSELISRFDNIIYCNFREIITLFESFYDTLVKDEDSFRKEKDSYLILDDLLMMVLNNEDGGVFGTVDTYEKFLEYVFSMREFYYLSVFRDSTFERIKNGDFSLIEFKDINDEKDLDAFKEAILYNIYGIEYRKAKEIFKVYGVYLDELEKDIDLDKNVFSVLKAICNIVTLEVNELDKINYLRMSCLEKIKEKGINYRDSFYSFAILEGLFNKMYMHTYNDKLLKDGSVIEIDDGIKVIDAGTNFNIMLSALDVVNKVYQNDVNMKSQWNSAFYSDTHALCCSYVTNESLGVIKLPSVMLGFSNIPDYSLNKMGLSDIFSRVSAYDLRRGRKNFVVFCPSSTISDENRYGFNEFVLDRFLLDDKDKSLKLQPDYVVFYKFDDDYKDSDNYKNSLKTARDFNIPIVMVDVLKIKENEKREISLLEDELFSRDKCDCSLMRDIVTRYMNNYTGSLEMVHSKEINYFEDFSVKGMKDFFDKIFSKIDTLSLEDKKEWLDSLEKIYLEEEEKFKVAKRVGAVNNSVQIFGLKRYDLQRKIDCVRNGIDYVERDIKTDILYSSMDGKIIKKANMLISDGIVESEESITDVDNHNSVIKVAINPYTLGNFVRDEDCHGALRTILTFLDDDNSIYVDRDMDLAGQRGTILHYRTTKPASKSLIDNLILSYFFESDRMILDDLMCHDFDCDISFKCTDDFDFCKCVGNYHGLLDKKSPSYIHLDEKKVDVELRIIDYCSNEEFLQLFSPVIDEYSRENNERFEAVAVRLLDKKNNMRNEFNKLLNQQKSLTLKR